MKLSSYENPLSGKRNSIFDFGNLWSQILGVVILIMVFVFGQKLYDWISSLWNGGATANNSAPVTRTRIVF